MGTARWFVDECKAVSVFWANTYRLASFPGPAQLSVALQYEEVPGNEATYKTYSNKPPDDTSMNIFPV